MPHAKRARTGVATAVTCAMLAACAVLPAAASAVPARGVVSGPVYEAGGGAIAVPTLFSRQTDRRLGLRSSVGLSIIPAGTAIPVPGGGTTLPAALRVGDRFRGSARVGRLVRRTSQPRIAFRTMVVYQRPPQPSTDLLLTQVSTLLAQSTAQSTILAPLSTTVEELIGTTTGTTVILQTTIDRVTQLEGVLAGVTNTVLADTIANAGKLTSITQMQLDSTVANAAKLAAHSQATIDSTVTDAAKLAAHSQATIDDTVTNAAKLAAHSQATVDDTVTNAAKLTNLSQATLEATVTKVDNLCAQVATLSQEFNDLRAALNAAALLGLDLSGVAAVPAFNGVTCAP